MMYVTLTPVILSGIANMAWCKSSLLESTRKPIDNGKSLSDGKRIFGENKTWKGMIGYLFFNALFTEYDMGATFDSIRRIQYSAARWLCGCFTILGCPFICCMCCSVQGHI